MKPMGMAALPQIADLHPASAFAPAFRETRYAPAPRPRPSLWLRLLAWQRVARERRRLLDLDDRILKDIGVTREQAQYEALRPFWDNDAPR